MILIYTMLFFKSNKNVINRYERGKFQLSRSTLLIAALIVAMTTATFITVLNQWVDRSAKVKSLLIDVKGELSQVSVLEWQAIAQGKITPSLFTQLQVTRAQTSQMLAKLSKIDLQEHKLKRFFQLYSEYNKAVDTEFKLISAGQITQAIATDEQQVDPAYEMLKAEIAQLNTTYSQQEQLAKDTANFGSALALFLATGVIGFLLWQFASLEQTAKLAIAKQKALSQSEERFRALVQNASDVIIVLSAQWTINYVSGSVKAILHCCPENLVGSNILNLLSKENKALMQNLLVDCLHSPINPSLELYYQCSKDRWCYVEIVANNLLNHPSVGGIVLTLRDISDRKRALEKLRHNAYHDALTDLPNRTLFMERLQQAVKQAKSQDDYTFALLFLDLDRFKIVNDSLGHAIGDQLLIAAARRLESCLREGDTIARFGGDEFGILLDDIEKCDRAIAVAQRIARSLALPFNLDGNEIFISTSIGIALGNKAIGWLDDILRNVDIAMYRAKALGKARYEVFDTAMHTQIVQRLQLETDLRRAIEQQEFRVYYQPIILLETGEITGFEALVRWQHPERGFISPAEFIPLAEETGLIVAIGEQVVRQACQQTRAWQKQFATKTLLTISVNLSVKQLQHTQLIEQIALILLETELSPLSLRLEITESLLMKNEAPVHKILSQLKALGILLYLDDFGTGYSSLSHLHCFPIDTLKIDRCFVNRMTDNDQGLEIVQAIAQMAHALGMDVVAEGVETPSQLCQLVELKCKYGQGYLFSQPLDAEGATVLLERQINETNKQFISGDLSTLAKLRRSSASNDNSCN